MKVYHLKQFDHIGNRMFVNLQHWKKGDASVEHLHDCVEIMYVLSGNGINCVNQVSYPIIAGDIYIINRSLTHSFFASENLVFYNLIFSFSLFSKREMQLFREVDGFNLLFHPTQRKFPSGRNISKLVLPPHSLENFKKLFLALCQSSAVTFPAAALNGKAHLILLLNELCSLYRQLQENRILIPIPQEENTVLPALLEFIHRNFNRNLTIEEIASSAHLSKNYIGEFFRSKTGVTLIKYINTLRIEKARSLLTKAPQKNIAEIADACGFYDVSYFARVFREKTGFSPTRYRTISANNL